MTIEQVNAGLEKKNIIELLEFDLTDISGGILRFYSGVDESDLPTITFLGEEFSPLPFVTDGWELDGTGKTPRPIITISDFNGIILTAVIEGDDLIGLPVRRWITTLDLVASGSASGPEKWLINQIQESDGFFIKFNLASPLDQKDKNIPFRQMFKDDFPAIARNRVVA